MMVIFTIKSRSRRKTEQMQKFFWDRRPRVFCGSLLARFTVHHLANFGWVPFADLRLQNPAMKQNAEFTEGG